MRRDEVPGERAGRLAGVCFDLDDTLYPAREIQQAALGRAWREVVGEPGESPAPPGRLATPEAIQEQLQRSYHARFGYGTPGYAELAAMPVDALALALIPSLFHHFGTPDIDKVEPLARRWRSLEDESLQPYPEVAGVLRALRSAGLRLGVITNGPGALQRKKLMLLGLADEFDAIVIDTEFGHPKPDRRIFDHARAQLGAGQGRLLFVGDSLEADIAGARDSGWIGVWCSPRGRERTGDGSGSTLPHACIDRLGELLPLVRSNPW